MPISDKQELDRRIQNSLVDRVRHASRDYRSASAPLETYLSALEDLADYIGARCHEQRPVLQFPVAKRPFVRKVRPNTKQENQGRVIPFALPNYPDTTPFPAA